LGLKLVIDPSELLMSSQRSMTDSGFSLTDV